MRLTFVRSEARARDGARRTAGLGSQVAHSVPCIVGRDGTGSAESSKGRCGRGRTLDCEKPGTGLVARFPASRCRLLSHGQGLRVVREGAEIGKDVRPLLGLADARESHVRARDVAARIGDEGVELLKRPGPALALERRRIAEARMTALFAADHVVEVRADLVGTV